MNKKAIAIGAGLLIVGLIVGRASAPKCSEDAHTNLVKEVTKLSREKTDLQIKLKEAKPYFEMKQSEKDALKEQAKKAEDEKKAKELEAKSKTLSNGHFIAGKDFDAGTYNIEVVKGNGNVYSSNMYDGGLNAMMGTDNSMYQSSYSNIKLPSGTELSVDSVTIKLIPTN